MTNEEMRAKVLFGEVETAVGAGKSILISKNDTTRRVGRYLNTQKRAIAMNLSTFLLTATIAVLGGPIAAAVALGGAVVSWGLGTLWDRMVVSRSRGKYLMKKKAGLEVMQTQQMQLAGGSTAEVTGFRNADYTAVLGDVKKVLSKQGLTDVYNALANLDVDFLLLKRFIKDPSIDSGWTKGTFGPTRKPALAAAAATPAVAYTATVSSCNDAVELWENICRINYRYSTLAETHAMLDEFILFMVLTISQYDANERRDLKDAWNVITQTGGSTAKGVLDSLNKAVNQEGIQHHAFRRLMGRERDYTTWVYGMIPDYVKDTWSEAFRLDMYLEVLRRTDKKEFEKQKGRIVAGLIEARNKSHRSGAVLKVGWDISKEYLAQVVSLPDGVDGESLGGAVKSNAITVGSTFLSTWLNSLQSEAWQTKFTAASAADPDSLASLSSLADARSVMKGMGDPFSKMGPNVIMGIATSVVKVAIEAANDKWNEYQLASGKTFDITSGGMRQQSMGERLGTLRTFAKAEIEAYIDLLETWNGAYLKLSGSCIPEQLPGAFLVHLKCSQEFHSNRTGQFFEELVSIANEMEAKARKHSMSAQDAVKSFVAGGPGMHVRCKGQRFCYGSLATACEDWLASKPGLVLDRTVEENIRRVFSGLPVRCTAGDQLEYFKDQVARALPPDQQYLLAD